MLDVDHQDIVFINEYAEEDEPPAPLEFLQFAQLFFSDNALVMPSCVSEALDLYILLLHALGE